MESTRFFVPPFRHPSRLQVPAGTWLRALGCALALLAAPAARAQAVVRTKFLSSIPTAAAVNPVTNKIYVTCKQDGQVLILDGADPGADPVAVAVGAGPGAIAVNPATNRIFVANTGDHTVSVLDGANPAATPLTVNVGARPQAIVVNPVTNLIFVANGDDGTVSVLDGNHLPLSGTAPVVTLDLGANPTGPKGLTLDPARNRICVLNGASHSVSLLDGANLAAYLTGTVAPPQVSVGQTPYAMALNPVTGKLYVTTADGLSVVDLGSGSAAAPLDLGAVPGVITVDAVANRIYVAVGASTVKALDGANLGGVPAASWSLGGNLRSLALNEGTNQLYVSSQADATVYVLDGANVSALPVALSARTGLDQIAVNPLTNMAYALATEPSLTVLDGARLSTTTLPTRPGAWAMRVHPLTGRVYVANPVDNTVSVLGGTHAVPVGRGVNALAVDPVRNRIYAYCSLDRTVVVLDGADPDPSAALATVRIAPALGFSGRPIFQPDVIEVNPVTGRVFVANYFGGALAVLDGANGGTLLATVTVGNAPCAVAVDPGLNRIYVANNGNGTVSVLDGDDPQASPTQVTVSDQPQALAVNPRTHRVYVAHAGSNEVSVLDGVSGTLEATAPVPFYATAVVVDPARDLIYAAHGYNNNVSVLDGANLPVPPSLPTCVTVGSSPIDLALDPQSGKVYVANQDNTVSVLDPANLPAEVAPTVTAGGGPWALALNAADGTLHVLNHEAGTVTRIDLAGARALPVTIGATPRPDAQQVANPALYVTRNPAPAFDLMVQAFFSTLVPAGLEQPPTALWYRLDDAGPWTQTTLAPGGDASQAVSSLSLPGAGLGLHTLSLFATYGQESAPSSDANGTGGTSAVSTLQTTTFLVLPQDTTLALTSDDNPAKKDDQVTFTATVQAATTPTGPVSFYADGAFLGRSALGAGSATFHTSTLAVGDRAIRAVYAGDSQHGSSEATLTQTVQARIVASTTVLTASQPAVAGGPVTLTATVSGAGGTPTGTVTFAEGAATLGTAQLTAGVATLQVTFAQGGAHPLTASYGGDSGYDLSSGSLAVKVGPTLTLTSSGQVTQAGQEVTLTATVTDAGGTATGTVTFTDGAVPLGTATLTGNTATLTLSFAQGGAHALAATYGGDATFGPATTAPLTLTVQYQPTVVLSGPGPITRGQGADLTATVSSASGSPTGSVVFLFGAQVLGTVALAAPAAHLQGADTVATAVAVLHVSGLPVGVDRITARYEGDGDDAAAVSEPLDEEVDGLAVTQAPPPTVTLNALETTTIAMAMNSQGLQGAEVTLAVSGLPLGVTCVLDPPTFPGTDGPHTVTLTLGGAAPGVSLQGGRGSTSLGLGAAGLLTCGLFALPGSRRRRRFGILLCALAVLAGLSACHGGRAPAPAAVAPPPSTVTVTMSAQGTVQATSTFQLLVD